jgi:competence protein ComEA
LSGRGPGPLRPSPDDPPTVPIELGLDLDPDLDPGLGAGPEQGGEPDLSPESRPHPAGVPGGGTPSIRARVLAALGDRLPATLRGAVVDPAARGAVMLAILALAGSAAAGWLAWHARAVPLGAQVTDPVPATGGTPWGAVSHTWATPHARAAASEAGAAASASAQPDVVVDVAGKVLRPGVVRLRAGARVIDAVEKAGGVLPGTDTTGLALARVLVDGEQVLVDGRPGPAPPGPAAAPAASPAAAGTGGPGAGTPVNLNTATVEQLDALPGVGPVLAQRIVEWREAHGAFTSPDQLGEVSGVGDGKLADLLPLVRT